MQKVLAALLYGILLFMSMFLGGCALMAIRAYEKAQDASEVKNTMDVSCVETAPPEEIWLAAESAAQKLGITIDSKDFNGNEGMIKGHTISLAHIRIFVFHVNSHETNVGIQARKEIVPKSFSQYDYDFASSLMTTIRGELHLAPNETCKPGDATK